MLKDFLTSILSVPLSDLELTKILNEKPLNWQIERLKQWLINIEKLTPRLKTKKPSTIHENWLIVDIDKPYKGKVGFRFILKSELLTSNIELLLKIILTESEHLRVSIIVLVINGNTDNEIIKNILNNIWILICQNNKFLFIEPEWATAIIVENLMPIYSQLVIDKKNKFKQTSYFEEDTDKEKSLLTIQRTEDRLQFLLDNPSDNHSQNINNSKGKKSYTGTTLLCTTFLPRVTYSLGA